MSSLLVLYTIDTKGRSREEDYGMHGFELPLPGINHLSKEVLLGDVLHFIQRHPHLSQSIGIHNAFYAEVRPGEFVLLPSHYSVLPVRRDGTVMLKIRRAAHGSAFGHQQGHHVLHNMVSRRLVTHGQLLPPTPMTTPTQEPSRAAPYRDAPYRDADYVAPPSSSTAYQHQPSASRNYPPSSSSVGGGGGGAATPADMSLQAIVGEDAAVALAGAAEVAKEAAKSLFSFASLMGKSVVEATTNTINTAVTGAGAGFVGSNVQVGNTRVQVQRLLSEGGFGTVYLVHGEQRPFALKVLNCQSREQVTEAHREIDALKLFHGHPHIIQLVDHASLSIASSTATTNRQVMLLFPLYPRGTAWDAIERVMYSSGSPVGPWPFPEARALYVIQSMAKALHFMHEKGYTHRDVKPHNMLLADVNDSPVGGSDVAAERFFGMGKPVLMDFGSMAPAKVPINNRQDALRVEDEASVKTSAAYRAPELTSPPMPPYVVDESVDVWGLGCSLYCLAFGTSPFENSREGVLRLAILNGKFAFPSGLQNALGCSFSDDFAQLISAMLQVESKRRPSIHQIIERCEQLIRR